MSAFGAIEIYRHCLLLLRVSDAGREGSCQVSSGRRPKAAKERTRGRWCGERAAHSVMGI
jgi:hypothetical protein